MTYQCHRQRRIALFAPSVVLGLAPWLLAYLWLLTVERGCPIAWSISRRQLALPLTLGALGGFSEDASAEFQPLGDRKKDVELGFITIKRIKSAEEKAAERANIVEIKKDILRKVGVAVRVVRPPSDPDTCYAANEGDMATVNYAAGYTMKDIPGVDSKANELAIDLLDESGIGDKTGMWDVYDSTLERGLPFDLPLGYKNVALGVDLGIQGMCPGEKRVIYCPAELGYGNRGSSAFGVPPQANLRWDVELVSVIGSGVSRGSPGGNRFVLPILLE